MVNQVVKKLYIYFLEFSAQRQFFTRSLRKESSVGASTVGEIARAIFLVLEKIPCRNFDSGPCHLSEMIFAIEGRQKLQ